MGCGTGLGLASVYGVIENHCGQIQVESTYSDKSETARRLGITRKILHNKLKFYKTG